MSLRSLDALVRVVALSFLVVSTACEGGGQGVPPASLPDSAMPVVAGAGVDGGRVLVPDTTHPDGGGSDAPRAQLPEPRGRDGGAVDAGPRDSAPRDATTADAGDAGGRDAAPETDGTTVVSCPAQPAFSPGETTRMLKLGAVSRTYILHVPRDYSGKEPVPLVIDWHGLLLDGATQRAISGYAELSDKEGFIVAFPEGIDSAWNVGPCCTTSRDVDDVAFARALVKEIATLACVDARRVYSVGYSMGGGMSFQLACRAADLFAAIAPAAFDLLAEDEQPCRPSRPISVIAFRGRDDFIVPYEGGASNPPNGLPVTIHFRGAQATFAFWKEANRCAGAPSTENGCETYAGCAGGVQTTLCTSDGLGGHIPGDAARGWSVLKRYTLP